MASVSRPSARAAGATARVSMRSDVPRSRLERREPASGRVGTRTARSPRAIKNRSNEPETCRRSSSAHPRSRPRPRAHCSTCSKARTPTLTVLSPSISPVVAAIPPTVCEPLHVRTQHDHQLSPLLLAVEVDGPRTRLAGGAATLLSSHAGTSPTSDERHSERWSGPTADSLKKSRLVPRARSRYLASERRRRAKIRQKAWERN
jgi:hypothetical protein